MANNYVNKYADFISQENLKESKKTMSKDDIATLEDPKHKVDEKDLEAFADIHEAISNSLLEDYDVSDITEEEFDDYVLDVIAEMVENSDELLESEDLQENAVLAVLKLLARKINPGRLSTSKKITAVKTPKRDARFYHAQDLRGVNSPTRADAIKTTTEQLRQLKKLRTAKAEALTSKLEQELKALKAPPPSAWQQIKAFEDPKEITALTPKISGSRRDLSGYFRNSPKKKAEALTSKLEQQLKAPKAPKAPIAADKFRKEVSDKIVKMAADKLKLTPAALGAGVSIGREIDKREIDKKINKKSKGPHTEEYGDDAPKAKRGRPSKDEGDVEHPFQQVRTAHTKGRVQGDHIRITHPSTNANKMIHKDDVKAYYNKYVNSQKPAQKEQCTSDFLARHFGAEMTRAQMLKHY